MTHQSTIERKKKKKKKRRVGIRTAFKKRKVRGIQQEEQMDEKKKEKKKGRKNYGMKENKKRLKK